MQERHPLIATYILFSGLMLYGLERAMAGSGFNPILTVIFSLFGVLSGLALFFHSAPAPSLRRYTAIAYLLSSILIFAVEATFRASCRTYFVANCDPGSPRLLENLAFYGLLHLFLASELVRRRST